MISKMSGRMGCRMSRPLRQILQPFFEHVQKLQVLETVLIQIQFWFPFDFPGLEFVFVGG